MEVDASNMKQIITDSPQQLRVGLTLAEAIKVKGKFGNIIVCGIGGSALPADLVAAIKPSLPLYIHCDYDLPPQANKKSLVICISYSGNTEETVSALKMAIEKKFSTVCMATGGKVEELCQKNNIPFIKLPIGIQPRSATGYIFSALVKTLENAGMLENVSSEVEAIINMLEKIMPAMESRGKELAEHIANATPITYASTQNGALAKIWKIKFNENSKIPAFYNVFPELNHNEMVGYTNPPKVFSVIMLHDSTDHPRNVKRMELTMDLIKNAGLNVKKVTLQQGSRTFTLFAGLLLGDWTSYYLALAQQTDPTPVKIVEDFKKSLQ